MSATHEKERTLTKQIGREVETALPGVEVLAVVVNPDRFTVLSTTPRSRPRALRARHRRLREYQRDYAIDVSSPGIERPCALLSTSATRSAALSPFARPSARSSRARSSALTRVRVVVRSGDDTVEIPYDRSSGQPGLPMA